MKRSFVTFLGAIGMQKQFKNEKKNYKKLQTVGKFMDKDVEFNMNCLCKKLTKRKHFKIRLDFSRYTKLLCQ